MIKNISLVILLSFCWVFSSGQNQYADSLRGILNTTTNPIERFDLLNNILLDITTYRGSNIDSLSTVQLIQIAQQQNNDSLLAISYNWLATFFSQKKGDYASALEYYFKALPLAEKTNDKRRISSLYFDMALVYFDMQDNGRALEVTRKGGENLPDQSHLLYYFMLIQYEGNLVQYFLITENADSAFHYAQKYSETVKDLSTGVQIKFFEAVNFGASYALMGNTPKADEYFSKAIALQGSIENVSTHLYLYSFYLRYLLRIDRNMEALNESRKLLEMGFNANNNGLKLAGASFLRQVYEKVNQIDSAYYYSRLEADISSQIFSQENKNKVQALAFNNQLRSLEEQNKIIAYQNQLRQYGLIGGLCVVLLIALILFYNNRQKQKGNMVLENTLKNLQSTQTQLIHSEKMASLGELTAGIAHEIQNPLNFVNNFSDLNRELIDEQVEELDKGDIEEAKIIAEDIKANELKINHHGKRAEEIVKSMLQHSRTGSGEKELTDINALADEYLRLSYHGLRAKDKNGPTGRFNADFKADLDPDLPKIMVIPQDIGRVILNLINNAFQACRERSERASADRSVSTVNETNGLSNTKVESDYKPEVIVSTQLIPPSKGVKGDVIQITVSDNGSGIPTNIREKIFQPFFTTKAAGEGTGLGLSMSYDIVTKGHGGTLVLNSDQVNGTSFTLTLPVILPK